MTPRIAPNDFYRLIPAIPQSLVVMHKAAAELLDSSLTHLVHYRVSQLNGCAYCQHMHAAEARRDGERQERLDMLAAWREAPGFSQRERLALSWAEALTRPAQNGVKDELFDAVQREFGEQAMAALTAEVLIINSWNRIAIAYRFVPELSGA